MEKKNTEEYTPESVSVSISYYWQQKKQEDSLRLLAGKKATRSAFAAETTTLNGEEASEAEATEKALMTKKTTSKPAAKGKSGKRKRQDDSNSSNWPRKKREYTDPCSACGAKNHKFTNCFLVQRVEKSWITQDSKDTFNKKMRSPAFKKKIEDY